MALAFRSDEPEIRTVVSVYLNEKGFLCVNVTGEDLPEYGAFTLLDKDTAIKFAKEVRKQISFMEDGNHGE